MSATQEPFEIIAVGNELLNGKTVNTNAHWLGGRITSMGGYLQRCTVVRDELEHIASAARESLNRKTAMILVTGGLGPTFDDLTLKGVAQALDRDLVVNEQALEMVTSKYRHITSPGLTDRAEITPAREKMARMPVGSKPLHNPIGTAPGVLLEEGRVAIVCLPGVPEEMHAIFLESVAPLVKSIIGERAHGDISMRISKIFESDLAPLIDSAMEESPDVYIKSHPKGAEGGHDIEIQLTATGRNRGEVEARIRATRESLQSLITGRGGIVDAENSVH